MKNIIKLLSICLVCGVCSCSDLTFGDKFLGSQPESSGAVLDSMFRLQSQCRQSVDKRIYLSALWVAYGGSTQ